MRFSFLYSLSLKALNQRVQAEKDRHQQEIIALQDNYQGRVSSQVEEYKNEVEELKQKIELMNGELTRKSEEIQRLKEQLESQREELDKQRTASGEDQSDKPPTSLVVSQEELAVPLSSLRIDASPNHSNKSDDGWCLNGKRRASSTDDLSLSRVI